ncbi:AmpG family muropeptide MFS transporter [Kangiella spongicola]|uniref:AmpG family muropeptide MFS transporter n=2 Tax=Kangiella spongicola TaxID=796379 RepID=A0A318D3E2_9GAMM|nr:MFS transporter [Kangiella spongicola]PXF63816.1 AmpG family muropeptide MFS transporter [Kangiella spongicola]
MLFLGFSAGLPLLLVLGTLSLLLKDAGISKSEIGFASWIGLAYSIKVLWSPVVDNFKLPILSRLLGKRKGWLLFAQVGIAIGLYMISQTDAGTHTQRLVIFALITAFLSATQDIVIDAFRVESNDDKKQGAAAATYIMGYRLGMIVAGAGALKLAANFDWSTSYQVMALCMGVGIIGGLLSPEPPHKKQVLGETDLEKEITETVLQPLAKDKIRLKHKIESSTAFQYFVKAVLSPFVDFFKRYKWWGLVIIAFILSFRVSDIVLGVMTNVFYDDMGFTKDEIADYSKIYGVIMTILGAFIGGYVVNKVKILWCLLWGIVLVILTNLLFAYMATQPKDVGFLISVISADNMAGGFSMGVLMAYFATLINQEFTATQFALYTSLMTLTGKILGGFSGVNIENWGYPMFFTYAASLGIPAFLLILALFYRERRLSREQ